MSTAIEYDLFFHEIHECISGLLLSFFKTNKKSKVKKSIKFVFMEKKTRLRILFSRNVLHTKQYNPKIITLIIHVKIII